MSWACLILDITYEIYFEQLIYFLSFGYRITDEVTEPIVCFVIQIPL